MHINTVRMANRLECNWELRIKSASILLVVLITPRVISFVVSMARCELWPDKALSIHGKEINREDYARCNILSHQVIFFCLVDCLSDDKCGRGGTILPNGVFVTLIEDSLLIFVVVEKDECSWPLLFDVAVRFINRTPRFLNKRPSYTNTNFKVSEFALIVDSGKTRICFYEEQATANNAQGIQTLISGEAAVAEKGSAPVSKLVVWCFWLVRPALYCPHVIYICAESYTTIQKAVGQYPKLALYKTIRSRKVFSGLFLTAVFLQFA